MALEPEPVGGGTRRCDCGKDRPGALRCTRRVRGPVGTVCADCYPICECECGACAVAIDGVEEFTDESGPEYVEPQKKRRMDKKKKKKRRKGKGC